MPTQTYVPTLLSATATKRGVLTAQTTTTFRLIRAEYLEIPGLHLTRKQVQRLWDLDSMTCDALLEALVDVQFLRQTRGGGYVRADSDCR